MTPFKKIKVLTQAELDAIELAGTQEEGVDYRIKGEINYYLHRLYITMSDGKKVILEAISNDITPITTLTHIENYATNYLKSVSYWQSNSSTFIGVHPTIDGSDHNLTFNYIDGSASYQRASYYLDNDISSILDTVMEL